MQRRLKLLLTGVLLWVGVGGLKAADHLSTPNIVLMMGDDHGWEETGFNGHPHVRTPVLDEMAAVGLRFDRFYAAHSSCSPTRASFLTGRHPNRMGTFAPGWSFRPEETTIAHILSARGYRCGHFGKWHVGAVKRESPVSPGAMGFHEWLSHDNFFELNPSLSRNGMPPEVFQGESSDILVTQAMDFIRLQKSAGTPFLTVIWFGSPHEPYSGLPDDLALYDDLPGKYNKNVKLTSNETGKPVTRRQGDVLRERYAEITAMDRAIGKLRTFLDGEGLRENTLLFYCGDNGTSADGALGVPHRGVKASLYEGGILVPGLVEWPARIKTPIVSHYRATTSDLLPTLCDLVDGSLPPRPMDGVSLLPIISGEVTKRPKPLYFWEYRIRRFSGVGSMPYIPPELQSGTTPLAKLSGGKATRDFVNLRHPGEIIDEDYKGAKAIIVDDFKLVIHDSKDSAERIELFNLKSDPGEKNDLATKRLKKVASMKKELTQWQTSVLQSLLGNDYQPVNAP